LDFVNYKDIILVAMLFSFISVSYRVLVLW